MLGIEKCIQNQVNCRQVKALLWKDVLVRIRTPWMTLVQYIWPCLIFVALYALRLKFQADEVGDCQFPTRQLPSQSGLLPFFQSYICTIENECSNTSHYEEITKFEKAPATPIVNIVQMFLNEDELYHAIVDLPKTADFLGSITTVATHPKFKVLEDNVGSLMNMVQQAGSPIEGSFDIQQLWSDDMTFSKTGNVLCGKPFPRNNNIRFVDRVFYQEDFNGANQDELDAMPTKYCKQLYLDVTNTNNGKITWNYIKPIIQGKILYGPVSKETQQIMMNANDTLIGMNRLKDLTKSLETIIKNLRVEGDFRNKFLNIVNLAQTPFVKALIASFNIDYKILDTVFNALLEDKQVADIVGTVANIFECFSVNRFVGVENETEMEDVAVKLNEKKLFLAGVYFEDVDSASTDLRYKLRMDIDNTPVTLENRNRFWFPGPDANFELQMRYHRGFIQIQHIIDRAIMKSIVQEENKRLKALYEAEKAAKEEEEARKTTTTTAVPTTTTTEEPLFSDEVDLDGDENAENSTEIENTSTTTASHSESSPALDDINSHINSSEVKLKLSDEALDDFLGSRDKKKPKEPEEGTPSSGEERKKRKKRSPQIDIFSMFSSGGSSSKKAKKDDDFPGALKMPDFEVFTKQFPYPKYRKDSFKTGLYLAQSVQLAFFFALIVQVSVAVRNRIWMRESGNSTLMRIMGLEKSSENTAWVITTFIEICFIFLLCEIILYSGGILETSSKLVVYTFLVIFACCVVAFCYMVSTFFSSASIGSVSAVILFLMTYMPYIVIIALGTVLSTYSKILASLSISSAFCYAWHYILRLELQQKELTFSNAFSGSFESNDLKFGITMIIVDLILYTIIGYLYERFTDDEFKFHKVPTKDMDIGVGGAIHGCTKKFGDSVRAAVDNVSIVFRRDYITCLLGRNGAGKSTIIKLLTGQFAPTSGQVFLQQNLDRISGNEYKERVGLCSQNNVLIPNLTAKEHLELYARIKSNDKYPDREVDRVMNSLHFGKHTNFYSQNLSGGFKRRLNVAIAFIASPNLVILDEPCSGVDTKARKNIWDLISVLRKGRAVILATHYLDEAENLSDSILILNEGKVLAEHDPDSLKEQFTRSFTLHIQLFDVDKTKTIDEIKSLLEQYAPNCNILEITMDSFSVNIPYRADKTDFINYAPLLKGIEKLENEKAIKNFRIVSSNLEQIFNNLVTTQPTAGEEKPYLNGFSHLDHSKPQQPVHVTPIIRNQKLSEFEIIKALFKKRYLHFKRNYKLILCVLVLPTIFEIIAMGFMTLRPPGEHDVNLQFSRGLYKNSTELYSLEMGSDIQNRTYRDLQSHCRANGFDRFGNNCELFDSSEKGFRWVLNSHEHYVESRYGGVSFNDSRAAVWFNNKGYHAMPVFLNELNSATLRSTVDNSHYQILTNNHPFKLGDKELTTSSILQQVADAGISLILLVAFSLVIAGASVYIVNERLNGEKLQQKLCDVSFKTYWGVSFVWDFIIFVVALLLAVVVFKIFDIPVYTAKDNLLGICAILLLFGFATIPMVHLFEKLFTDASLANMYILCMNIILALSTITIVILFDILGNSEESEKIRDFLNRAFLVLPQHALADGLIEICKNHILAEVFQRYYINTYKSPIASNLLLPHFSALIACGIFFIICNYVIESGLWRSWQNRMSNRRNNHGLESITTVSKDNIISENNEKYDLYGSTQAPDSLRVENLSKTYDGINHALLDVTFSVKRGECFGLLGANGAGKSTIFGILSGELAPTSGTVEILNREAGISYCPQTNALDPLLTVEEIIHFYGKLRRIENIYEMTELTLKSYHLLPYRKVVVKHLSGGNRRKLSVAVTCFGSTSNVLMDEPTSDMDPVTRSIVYRSITQLMFDKRSVILTSHTITEIDRVCSRIGVLRQGQMIAIAPPHDLKIVYGNCYLATVYYDHIEALTIERDLKKAISGIENLVVHNHCLQFRVKVRSPNNIENNNSDPLSVSPLDFLDGIEFSELFDKLHRLTLGRGIFYTITECLLDQAFERVLESTAGLHSYSNGGYAQSETPT